MKSQQCTQTFGKYVFSSDFDGGNAITFKQLSGNKFEVSPAADAYGSLFFI
jgi:hypothetical protein